MYKEVGLVLAGALCFDLGVVVVPARAADAVDMFIKIGELAPNREYLKIKMDDVLVSSKACVSNKGTLVEFKGTKYCQTSQKTGSLPSNQKK